jgi:phosphohistidine swiveling domain-containing protein
MADMMVVTSKVKAYIKEKGCMTSGDAVEALNKKVACMLDSAVERTKANKRSTVKPQDL